jgi:hypothetical protein
MLPRPRLQEDLAYHPPVLKKVVSPTEKILQAVLVAVVGTGLGIGVGVFLAGRTFPANSTASATPAPASNPTPTVGKPSSTVAAATQANTTQANAQTASVVPAGQTASAEAQEKSTGTQASSPNLATVAQTTAAVPPARPRLVPASLTGLRTGIRHRHMLHHRIARARLSIPKVVPPAPVEEVKVEVPDERFRFTIEGDQTAVSYDAQSGVVSTEGTGLFMIEKPQPEATTVRPQEAPSNVHYKCDQDENCSLVMASLVVPHARMQTVSHSTDFLAYVPVTTTGQGHTEGQVSVDGGQIVR